MHEFTPEVEALANEVLAYSLERLKSDPPLDGPLSAAALFAQEGAVEIVIPGDNPALLATVRSQWLPNAVTVWGEPVDSPLWAGREPGMAYVCRNHECLLPARTEQELRDRIATSFSGE